MMNQMNQMNPFSLPQSPTMAYQTPPFANQAYNRLPIQRPIEAPMYQPPPPRRFYQEQGQFYPQQYSPPPQYIRPSPPISNQGGQSISPARTIPSVQQMNFTPDHYNHQDNLMNSRMEQLEAEIRQLKELCKELGKKSRAFQNELTFDGSSSNEIKRLQQQLEIKERIIQQLAEGQKTNQNQNQGELVQLENEKNGLERQAMNLIKELGEKDKIIRQLQQKINDLQNNHHIMLQDQDKDQEIEQLHKALENLQEAQNEDLVKKDEEIEQLRSLLREIQGETQMLQEQLRNQRSSNTPKHIGNPLEKDNKDQEIQELKKKVEKFEGIIKKDIREIQDKDDQIKHKNEQIEDLQKQISALQKQVSDLKKKFDDRNLQNLSGSNKDDMNNLLQQLRDKEDQLTKFKNHQAQLNAQLQTMLGELDELNQKFAEQGYKLDQGEEKMKRLKQENDNLKKEMEVIQDEAEQKQAQHEQQLKQLSQKIRKQADQDEAFDKLDRVEQEAQKQAKLAAQRSKDLEQAQAKANELQDKNEDLQRDNDRLKNLLQRLQMEIKEEQQKQEGSVGQVENLRQDLTKLNKSFNQLQKLLAELQDLLGVSDNTFLKQRVEALINIDQRSKELQERIRQLLFQNQQMKEQIEFYEHEHQYLENYKMKYAQLYAVGEEKFQLMMLLTFAFAEIESLRLRYESRPIKSSSIYELPDEDETPIFSQPQVQVVVVEPKEQYSPKGQRVSLAARRKSTPQIPILRQQWQEIQIPQQQQQLDSKGFHNLSPQKNVANQQRNSYPFQDSYDRQTTDVGSFQDQQGWARQSRN